MVPNLIDENLKRRFGTHATTSEIIISYDDLQLLEVLGQTQMAYKWMPT